MRRVRYQVACSLDGFIATGDGGFDWIVMDPDIDFAALQREFDTLVMGRRTYQVARGSLPGMKVIVCSRSLSQPDNPGVTIVANGLRDAMDELRREPGRDIWLYGGGELFRSLLELDCVDTVEPAIIPVLLGGGRPFLPPPPLRRSLRYRQQRVYPKSGIVLLEYDVAGSSVA
jgi:dihydrofolate reductase